jgi:hypothetical protein
MICVLFFLCAASFLTAQSWDDEGERITALSISGLKRTKLSTAEKPLRKFINVKTDEIDTDEVNAAVLAAGILEPLSVEVEGQVLSVTVREKWAIFPVPFAMAGSGTFIAGLAFYDANAFGLNDKFFLAGLYYTGGWAATAGYMHTPPGGWVPGWNSFGIFSREERRDTDQRGGDIRRFELDSASFSAGLNFPLLEDTDLLSAQAQVSFNETIIRNSENAFNGPNEGLRLFGVGGDIIVRKNSWDGYLLSQEAVSLRYSYGTTLNGFSYQSLQFRGIWEKPLIPGFRVNLKTGVVFDPDAPVLLESSPSAAQVAILPRNFSARNYAGVSAGLEKYIIKIPVGTVSLLAAYQLVYSQGSVLEDSLDHGVMGMLTFYLSRLAIPAMSMGAAYNVKENYLLGSFSLGVSF